MRNVKAKNLEPGMAILGYPGDEFHQPPTIISVTKMSDHYMIEATLGATNIVSHVPEDRLYLVKEESDDE